jgi:hypothetical protein
MTPYADPNDKREWQKQNFRKRYRDPEFRANEAFRKGKEFGWYGKHAEEICARYRAKRSKQKIPAWFMALDLRTIKPIRQLHAEGKFGSLGLRHVLRRCTRGEFLAFKIANKWCSCDYAIERTFAVS